MKHRIPDEVLDHMVADTHESQAYRPKSWAVHAVRAALVELQERRADEGAVRVKAFRDAAALLRRYYNTPEARACVELLELRASTGAAEDDEDEGDGGQLSLVAAR